MITNKLIFEIKSKINDNQKQGITGDILQGVLVDMVESLSEAYPQTYTEEQKAQARANIDALSDHDGEITKEKLSAEVQAILNDVANKQNITDESLATIAKTIVGAINEVYKGGLEDASIATSKIEDGAITEPKLDTDLVNVITSAVQPAELASAIATALASYVSKSDILDTTGSATDKVMSQNGVTEAINGVTNKVTELDKQINGKFEFSGKHGEYFSYTSKANKPLTFNNNCDFAIKLYLRKEKSSASQVEVFINANSTQTFTPADDYNYIYIYNPSDASAVISAVVESGESIIASIDAISKANEQNKQRISVTNNALDALEETIISGKTISLKGVETSNVVLDTPIILSKNGDKLEIDYETSLAGSNASYAFSGSGLSTSYNYAIGASSNYISIRNTNGTWLFRGEIPASNNVHLVVEYKDGKIYVSANDFSTTIESQSSIQISTFGNGGNNAATYGYWKGVIKSAKVNGISIDFKNEATLNNVDYQVEYNVVTKTDIDKLVGGGILVYSNTDKKFNFFSKKDTDKYYCFGVQLVENSEYYLKEWRMIDGGLYSYNQGTFTKLADTLYRSENELAIMFKNGNYNGGYTGGTHGGERIDGDEHCGVMFFADGKEITSADMTSDFSIPCNVFSYIQVSTIHDSASSNAIRAHHVKKNIFKDCSSELENTIVLAKNDVIVQYHAGLVCIAKDASSKVFIPPYTTLTTSASEEVTRSNERNASTIDFWSSTNNIKASVDGHFVEGFSFGDTLPQSGLFAAWDRSTDTKYYRRTNEEMQLSEGHTLRNKQVIKFY